ncbi:replication factor C large subunit [Nanoarchaeota archaeon]
MQPWIRTYQPKKLSEFKGQKEALSQLKDFIINFKKQKKKAVFLYGPSGSGKTASICAIANELDLELIEINASDARNKDSINSLLGSALKQMSLFAKGKIILVDEVDGLSGHKDRGGIQALVGLLEKSAFPVIVTATDPFDKKFSNLRKSSTLIEFEELSYSDIFELLKDIAKKENIKYEEIALKGLARRAAGDVRAAINDFQTLTAGKKELTKDMLDFLYQRPQSEDIKNALLKVFKTTDLKIASGAFDFVDEDLDKTMLWIDENLPKEYKKPEDLARAYDYLSKSDIFNRRIRRWQHWRFLVYINAFLTGGIAASKDEKYDQVVSYEPTTRILKIWKANMRHQKKKAIAEKVARHTHCSAKEAYRSTLPYLQNIFKKNKKMASGIAEELDLDKDEVGWLSR